MAGLLSTERLLRILVTDFDFGEKIVLAVSAYSMSFPKTFEGLKGLDTTFPLKMLHLLYLHHFKKTTIALKGLTRKQMNDFYGRFAYYYDEVMDALDLKRGQSILYLRVDRIVRSAATE